MKCVPLQKLLGQSLSGIQSPLGQVGYAWDAETPSLFLHAGNGAYASAEIMMHNCLQFTAPQFYRASETNGWSQEYWKGLGRYYYTIQLTTTKLHTGNSVHWMCTHFFVSQPFLIHHFLQLLLPVRKFDCDKSQTAAPKKPFFKNNMMEQFQIPQRPDCPLSEPSTYLIARYLGKHTQFNIPLQSRSKRCDVTSFLSPHAGKWGYCKSSPGSLWPLWPSPSCGYSWRSRSSG